MVTRLHLFKGSSAPSFMNIQSTYTHFSWLLWLLFHGCAGSSETLYPDDASQRPVTVYVVGQGWHTAVVLEEKYIRNQVSSHREFPEGSHIMAEWGDARYFPHEDPGTGLLLRAALLPTGSVLHLTGLSRPPHVILRSSTVVSIQITERGAEQLGAFISSEFRYDDHDQLVYATETEGLYGNSAFFEGRKLYFFPRTSNRWVARALRETGYPIRSTFAFTARNVLRQSQKDGEVLR